MNYSPLFSIRGSQLIYSSLTIRSQKTKERILMVRRGNTKYRSPQLLVQNCFVTSFGSMRSLFFSPHDQLVAQQKHLLRVEEMQRADWFISQVWRRQVVSLMKSEQQSQNLLLKIDPRSTFRNSFLQPATKNIVAREKNQKKKAKHGPRACNETVLRDKLRVFVSRYQQPLNREFQKSRRQHKSTQESA